MGAYGGGQYELGVGRGQIQYLAAIFHPDGPTTSPPRGMTRSIPSPGCPRARSTRTSMPPDSAVGRDGSGRGGVGGSTGLGDHLVGMGEAGRARGIG